MAFICFKHVGERELEEDPSSKSWPINIDFASIPARLFRHYRELNDIVMNYKHSSYWKDFREQCEGGGKLQTLGMGQFNSCERTSTG